MSRDFIIGLLFGFGIAGTAVAAVFWIDRIIDFYRKGRRR